MTADRKGWKPECIDCMCPRLAEVEVRNKGLKDDIRDIKDKDLKEIKEDIKSTSEKINGIYRMLIVVSGGLVTASILLAINVIVLRSS